MTYNFNTNMKYTIIDIPFYTKPKTGIKIA